VSAGDHVDGLPRRGRCFGPQAPGSDRHRIPGKVVHHRGIGEEHPPCRAGADDGVAVLDVARGHAGEDPVELTVTLGRQGDLNRTEVCAAGIVQSHGDRQVAIGSVDQTDVGTEPAVDGLAVGQLDQPALLAGADRLAQGLCRDVLAEGGARGKTELVALTEKVVGSTGGDDSPRARDQEQGRLALGAELAGQYVTEVDALARRQAELTARGRAVVGAVLEQPDAVRCPLVGQVVHLDIGAPAGAQGSGRVSAGADVQRVAGRGGGGLVADAADLGVVRGPAVDELGAAPGEQDDPGRGQDQANGALRGRVSHGLSPRREPCPGPRALFAMLPSSIPSRCHQRTGDPRFSRLWILSLASREGIPPGNGSEAPPGACTPTASVAVVRHRGTERRARRLGETSWSPTPTGISPASVRAATGRPQHGSRRPGHAPAGAHLRPVARGG